MINSRDSAADNFNEKVYVIPFNIGTFLTENETNELFKVLEYIINSRGFFSRIQHIERENVSGTGPFKVVDMRNQGEVISIPTNELTENYTKSAFSYIVPKNNKQSDDKGISFIKKQ